MIKGTDTWDRGKNDIERRKEIEQLGRVRKPLPLTIEVKIADMEAYKTVVRAFGMAMDMLSPEDQAKVQAFMEREGLVLQR